MRFVFHFNKAAVVADRSDIPDASLWSAFSSADTGSIVCLSHAGLEASDVVDNAIAGSEKESHPLRRAWWMKHLSLLAVLQAACLAVGLSIHQTMQNAADASQVSASVPGGLSSPLITAFIWIASIQGGIGYLVVQQDLSALPKPAKAFRSLGRSSSTGFGSNSQRRHSGTVSTGRITRRRHPGTSRPSRNVR